MSTIQVDTITESTSNTGTTVEGVLLKDSQMASTYLDGGLVKLKSFTASGTSEIDFSTSETGWNNTTYRSFILTGRWIVPATDSARLLIVLASGTSKRTGTYELGMSQSRVDSSQSGYYQQDYSGGLEVGFQLGTGTREVAAFQYHIIPSGDSGSNSSGITSGWYNWIGKASNASTWYYNGGIQYDSTSYMDGAYISMSTGNIASGEFDFYGMK